MKEKEESEGKGRDGKGGKVREGKGKRRDGKGRGGRERKKGVKERA